MTTRRTFLRLASGLLVGLELEPWRRTLWPGWSAPRPDRLVRIMSLAAHVDGRVRAVVQDGLDLVSLETRGRLHIGSLEAEMQDGVLTLRSSETTLLIDRVWQGMEHTGLMFHPGAEPIATLRGGAQLHGPSLKPPRRTPPDFEMRA